MICFQSYGAIWLRIALLSLIALTTPTRGSFAQRNRPPKPEPTHGNVSYGPHDRNRLDFWAADTEAPSALVVYIHGGGFRGGSKESLNGRTLRGLLDAGISVAAINYRLTGDAPLPAAHQDCRSALQFLRSQADEWKIDPDRVGAFGGSAGAQLCMWLAFHDDMADPASEEALQRKSTRLQAVATNGGQTTMDFAWWHEHIPGYEKRHRPASDYFGDAPAERRREIVRDISALDLLTADDPPIYMSYRMSPDDPVPAQAREAYGWKVHHVSFGVALLEKAEELGVEAYLKYPGRQPEYSSEVNFFRAKLAR